MSAAGVMAKAGRYSVDFPYLIESDISTDYEEHDLIVAQRSSVSEL